MRTITNWLNVKDNRTFFFPSRYEVIVIIKEQKKRKTISVERKTGKKSRRKLYFSRADMS